MISQTYFTIVIIYMVLALMVTSNYDQEGKREGGLEAFFAGLFWPVFLFCRYFV